jgi:hypothetical protein
MLVLVHAGVMALRERGVRQDEDDRDQANGPDAVETRVHAWHHALAMSCVHMISVISIAAPNSHV